MRSPLGMVVGVLVNCGPLGLGLNDFEGRRVRERGVEGELEDTTVEDEEALLWTLEVAEMIVLLDDLRVCFCLGVVRDLRRCDRLS